MTYNVSSWTLNPQLFENVHFTNFKNFLEFTTFYEFLNFKIAPANFKVVNVCANRDDLTV